jgi:hypothetical protein
MNAHIHGAWSKRTTLELPDPLGNGVLLLPIADPWQPLEDGLAAFEP